jgi:hypothetical protein
MSLGKDSITKRVAKPAQAAKAPAKKAPAKKAPAAPKAAVIANVAPETVQAVTGAPEGVVKKVALGEAMPYYLL